MIMLRARLAAPLAASLLAFGLGSALANPPPAHAKAAARGGDDAPVVEHAAAKDPVGAAAGVLGQILHDNAGFAKGHPSAWFERFREGQHPRATIVGCSDSRVQTNDFDTDPDGDLFMIRNIGNQIDSNAGSVEYGVRHLNTPLLLILGHTSCGAIKAAMTDYASESLSVRHELDGLHLSIFRTQATGSFGDRWIANVIGNVHQQVEDALAEYATEVRAGHLLIVGAVYDFRNDLGAGPGRIVIINVNGEKDAQKIADSPLMKAADPQHAAALRHAVAPVTPPAKPAH